MGNTDSNNTAKTAKLIDLDFTGVFKFADLKLEPLPPPPRRIPQDLLIGAKSLEKGNCFVNLTRPRPTRPVDPKKTTILIVEDDVPTLNVLDLLLTRAAGYQTRRASDVQSFIQAMQKLPLADAVILDLNLPGNVSGFKILAKIRAHPVICDLPVIILTGHSSPEYLLQGLKLGADAYLSKPAKSSAVFEALKLVLGG